MCSVSAISSAAACVQVAGKLVICISFVFQQVSCMILQATLIPIENVKNRPSTESKSLNRLKYKKFALLQGESRDATVNFDTSRILQKSIMERLCTLNTATLSTRTHLVSKPAQNKPWRSLDVIQGHAFWDHWKADEGLHITVGFRVGNFEGKVWASPFWRSPSFGAPYLGNPCKYSHTRYISRK